MILSSKRITKVLSRLEVQAGLRLCCSQTPKTGFLALRPILFTDIYTRYQVICAFLGEKLVLLHANGKGSDQPVHAHSLISTFVILSLEDVKPKLVTCKISVFLLISVTE